jgi:hypothetical protein
MWSDNETTIDYLGFNVHADLIYEIVSDPCLLPITIGVFADWGGGKSSILRMLQERFSKEESEGLYCLYVNGWLFEGYDDAKSALIGSVLRQLAEHPTLGERIKKKILPFLKSVEYMRYIRLAMKGGVAATALSALGVEPMAAMAFLEAILPEGGTAKEEHQEDIVSIRNFRDKFEDLLKESKVKSLVILVDDLDRCSPQRIIENLEAIKLFLNVKHTAFVIGADRRLVSHAIRIHYRGLASGADVKVDYEDQIVNDYLEKLIHVPFTLPRLSVPEVETYMTMLFSRHHFDDPRFDKCLGALSKHIGQDRYTPFSARQVKECLGELFEKNDELEESLSFCRTAAPLIGDGLKGNPRQIKRFLNTYVVRKKLAKVAKLTDIRTDVLVKLMVLEYGCDPEYRNLYDFVRSQNGIAKEIRELEDACRVPEGGKPDPIKLDSLKWGSKAPFLHRWAQMNPALAGMDLRDYVWLSRDRMESTLAGIQLVAPYLKKIITELLSEQNIEREAAAKSAKSLDENDVTILLSELKRLLSANPRDARYYAAFDLLIRGQIQPAERSLAEALRSLDAHEANPGSGYTLAKLFKERSDLDKALKNIITELSTGNTKIGKTIKSALEGPRKSR